MFVYVCELVRACVCVYVCASECVYLCVCLSVCLGERERERERERESRGFWLRLATGSQYLTEVKHR